VATLINLLMFVGPTSLKSQAKPLGFIWQNIHATRCTCGIYMRREYIRSATKS